MDIKAILSDAIVKTAQQAIAAGVVKEGTLPEVQLTVPPVTPGCWHSILWIIWTVLMLRGWRSPGPVS